MKFHLPSFLLGVAAGAAGRSLWDRFRPVVTELTAAGAELGESLWSRTAIWQEDAEDAIVASRTRTRARARRSAARHARSARSARAARSR
jgi:hypothetical protein